MRFTVVFFIASFFFLSCRKSGSDSVCDRIFYSKPFPKRSVSLASRFGDKAVAVRYASKDDFDTVEIQFFFNKTSRNTTILQKAENTDTLFAGHVSYFRGIYFLSKTLTDTSYLIGGVSIDHDTIYGLGMANEQMLHIYQMLKNSKLPTTSNENSFARYDSLRSVYILNPIKSEMKQLYAPLLDTYPKYYLIK